MAYVAVTGGREAIAQSIELLARYRSRGENAVEADALTNRMSLLIDRIMSEAGLYAPDYAALALKQCEGSPEEAVFLLRAYRTTLSRSYYSLPMNGEDMRLIRRISAAFKDVPGGQMLGPTYDYTHRLLDFSPEDATELTNTQEELLDGDECHAPRVSALLRDEGLVAAEQDDSLPVDITQNPLTFPAPRSARLQTFARAETGYLCGLAYAGLRGFGPAHPTVGELRTGMMEVCVAHPLIAGETLYVGEIMATEVESYFSIEDDKKKERMMDPLERMQAGQGDKKDTSDGNLALALGYGLIFGRNDNKAIAMSIMDFSLETQGDSPLQNQELVLLHGDCLEMSGFISHLKLPHYVTFQSKLDRVRHTRKEGE